MLNAKAYELKNSFKQHYSVFKQVVGVPKGSYRLLLFYAVECGLKVLLLKQISGSTTNDILNHHKLGRELSGKNGHNIKVMLRYLGLNNFKLPNLPCKSKNNKDVHCAEYNQAWRYGIECDETVQSKILEELKKIAELIERRA